MERSFDFSTIFSDPSNFDSYNKGDFVLSSQFHVDDIPFYVKFYPKGLSSTEQGKSAVGIILDGLISDRRQLKIAFVCNGEKFTLSKREVRACPKQGMGPLFDTQSIKDNPIIKVSLTIFSSNESPKSRGITFDEQLQKMYAYSSKHGDITLEVKIISDSHDSDILRPPLQKRRRLNDEDASDEGLSVEDADDDQKCQQIKISGAILRAASPVFEQMMSSNMKEAEEKSIIIQAKSVKDVEDMAYFMCTNQLKKDADVLRLLSLAHLYQMGRLVEKCCKQIVSELKVDDFVETVAVLNKLNIENGLYHMTAFAKNHKDELSQRDDFKQLPCFLRLLILGDDI